MKKFLALSFILILMVGPACSKKDSTPPETKKDQTETENQATAQGTASVAKDKTAETQQCTYSTDPQTIQLEWTAYKFTEKAPVKGTFKSTPVQGSTSASSLGQLAQGLRMSIDGATIESGDPGRNITVKEFFFSKFNPPFKMEAAVTGFTGDDTQGNLTISLNMNGVVKEVPFAYTATPQGEIVAKGGINLMNWNLKDAFDSIHQACKTLHTGKDGVAKTWDVVDIKIQGKFEKSCR